MTIETEGATLSPEEMRDSLERSLISELTQIREFREEKASMVLLEKPGTIEVSRFDGKSRLIFRRSSTRLTLIHEAIKPYQRERQKSLEVRLNKGRLDRSAPFEYSEGRINTLHGLPAPFVRLQGGIDAYCRGEDFIRKMARKFAG